MKNDDIVIVSACRTAVGKSGRGSLAHVRPEEMGAAVLRNLVSRANQMDPIQIDDVIIGCAFPEGTQGLNFARVTVLSAGWPNRIPGFTVNRFCSSGLEAIAIGAQRIAFGQSDILIAGGIESMSQVPMGGHMMYPNPALVDNNPGAYLGMGATAENVADKYGVGRLEQDQFALQSHQRAEKAIRSGAFAPQIVPIPVRNQVQAADGSFSFVEGTFAEDEGVRADTSLEKLAKLKPVFRQGGSVTAGNSSQTSDGAAGVLLMKRSKAKELGLTPLARFVHYAVEGCSPEYMGIGPVVAVPKLLKLAGVTQKDVGLFELNEAFAAQSIACMNELKLDGDKVNVNGGAIALGHPLGSTGSVLTNKLIYEMKTRSIPLGIVTMCIGFGMGAAGLFELEG